MGRFKIKQGDGNYKKVAWKDEVDSVAGEGRTTETVKDNADKIGVLSNLTTTDKISLVGSINEVHNDLASHKEDYVQHLASEMPHQFTNLQTGKTYRFGRQVSAEGIPQRIYEEVIE